VSRRLALALGAVVLAAIGGTAARAADNPHAEAFVSEYRCDGEHALAVAYPAPRLRERLPVNIGWNGETVPLTRAAPAGGLRWTSRSADLAWTTQGRGATLTRVSDGAVLLAGCREQ
jgi:hypothetical protein